MPMSGPERHRGDIGRRVAARREQLGLSREDVALRAGSAPGYLQYLEEQAAVPGMGFLLRLADALETTVGALTGGTADLPSGVGQAAYRPELVELDPDECRQLLGTHGVGRVAVTTHEGPAIVPVNYVAAGGEIAFRTSPDSLPGRAAGREVAFEVDHIDEAFSRGWSVLLVGPARVVTDPGEARALAERAFTTPWAGAERDLWVVVAPARVTGRRIRVHRLRPESGA
ncbi:helix-turn-helix domain-containing protein [Streptomyces sudanensis]|uniref:Pyridoxamine 5'-phosphate oxidase family protein n=4 Tax=Streptomyces TaxID=1883 RepID=A0ABY4THK1_9ACTN|nr:pyridoxamine 5'-phosphate oxidase family protein [Streptomyces sudanensis]MCP9960024.1 pyridoxamine 5'-phosphate oxidase family protein [Streptomyces sudanensis]MCP9989040.1 pyridoxamine 5'-phosphate oxidase family protein [Streptomyces sudanensis]MCP9999577.1 pyridoxamine 5'-phosphate oxidase family protein [Streptomyces sudanensis]URN18351.1 pyridoxamine 5'-phosphate oxidase family protein [Streptomyces sudanensis]